MHLHWQKDDEVCEHGCGALMRAIADCVEVDTGTANTVGDVTSAVGPLTSLAGKWAACIQTTWLVLILTLVRSSGVRVSISAFLNNVYPPIPLTLMC